MDLKLKKKKFAISARLALTHAGSFKDICI